MWYKNIQHNELTKDVIPEAKTKEPSWSWSCGSWVGFIATCAISAYHHYSMQHYQKKFVGDLRQIGSFLRILRLPSSTNKTDRHDIAETLLKVAISTITLTLSHQSEILYHALCFFSCSTWTLKRETKWSVRLFSCSPWMTKREARCSIWSLFMHHWDDKTNDFTWGSCYSIFSFICMFCWSLIYEYWLPLWYLQTLLHTEYHVAWRRIYRLYLPKPTVKDFKIYPWRRYCYIYTSG